MAMTMLADLCGDDKTKWDECAETVIRALAVRRKFWDGIVQALDTTAQAA